MEYRRFKPSRALMVIPLLALLIIGLACGGTAAPPEPIVVEKEVIKEVPKEIIVEKEVIKEVPKEIIVEKEVIKEVAKEVVREVEVLVQPTLAPIAAPAEQDVPDWVVTGKGKHYNGTLPFVYAVDPGDWDPHHATSMGAGIDAISPMFNQLVEYDPVNTSEITGDLARSWDVSADGTVYTWHLADATFTDGSPVTAEDVVWSLDNMADPEERRGRVSALRRFYDQGQAEAIDDKTVRMTLKFPAATFMANLAVDWYKIIQKSSAEQLSQDDRSCCPNNLVGSGPWLFKEWKRGEGYSYERNPNYFKEGRPFFDGMEVFQVDEPSRYLAALQTGQVMGTHAHSARYDPNDMLEVELATGGKMRAAIIPAVGQMSVYLRTNQPPFDDPMMRRAVYLAVDRKTAMETAVPGFAELGSFFLPGYAEDTSELVKRPGYRYVDAAGTPLTNIFEAGARKDPADIEEAKRLVQEAGYGDGLSINLMTGKSKVILTATELIVEQLREIGIDITLQIATGGGQATADKLAGKQAMQTGGGGLSIRESEGIVDLFYDVNITRNPFNWADSRFTELLEAQTSELDPEKRRQMYTEMEGILHQGTAHNFPVFWYTRSAAVDYRIVNYQRHFNYHTVLKRDHIWFDPDMKVEDAIRLRPDVNR